MFANQPMAARDIVTIRMGGWADGRAADGHRRIKICPLQWSVSSIRNDLKLI